jgi:hypothetical protein
MKTNKRLIRDGSKLITISTQAKKHMENIVKGSHSYLSGKQLKDRNYITDLLPLN